MRLHFFIPALLATLILAAPATGQTYKNEDTAKDRQDYTWGTRKKDEGGGYFNTTERGDADWGTTPGPKKPERDWYDEVIITVSPEVGYGSKTTTTTDTNSTGDVTGSSTTTTTY